MEGAASRNGRQGIHRLCGPFFPSLRRKLQISCCAVLIFDSRLNGIRMRDEYEAKLAAEEEAGITCRGGRAGGAQCFGSRGLSGGFDVIVEGVAVSGPLETPGDIRVAMEHDWRFADIGGERGERQDAFVLPCIVIFKPVVNHLWKHPPNQVREGGGGQLSKRIGNHVSYCMYIQAQVGTFQTLVPPSLLPPSFRLRAMDVQRSIPSRFFPTRELLFFLFCFAQG